MMQAERGRRNSFLFSDNGFDSNGFATVPAMPSSSSPPAGGNYIEHRVSRRDTLAGVAIKYGVEVADIKRMNGLVTDLQMFAHESLHIPLPGRHPPSLVISDGSTINGEHTPSRHPLDDFLDSFQSLKMKPPQCRASSATISLQGDYGLRPPNRAPLAEGTEMSVYQSVGGYYLEDQPVDTKHMVSDPIRGRHRKSRSMVNIVAVDNSEAERSIRRHQKADADPFTLTPERLLKDDTFGQFSGRKGKNLAQRQKMGTRMDADMVRPNVVPIWDSLKEATLASVRKSPSTSNLQEPCNGSSMWPSSKWSSRPDAFNGLLKPVIIRKNKAALD